MLKLAYYVGGTVLMIGAVEIIGRFLIF